LDVQVSPRNFCSELADFLAHRTCCRFADTGILKDASAAALRELESGAEEAGQDCEAGESGVVIVYIVTES
jgi:hypothetical protein